MRARRRALLGVLGFLLCNFLALRSEAAEATITSDELEIQNNGELTIFRGHVDLKQSPYEIRADRMVRKKADASVDAAGHVIGKWQSAKGEKLRVDGEMARYEPSRNIVEIWGHDQVMVQVDGEKGTATFHGDRGAVDTRTPGKARLTGHVTGHVIPVSAS